MTISPHPLLPDTRSRTTATLVRTARSLTARRGLADVSVAELCDAAAIDVDEFAEYFASVEDAVLGVGVDPTAAYAAAHFLAGGDGTANGLGPTVLDELVEVTLARWRVLDIAPDSARDLLAAVEREPRLVGRMLEHAREREAFDARLVEQREDLATGDPHAAAAAQIVGAVARAAARDFLREADSTAFATAFDRRLAAMRELFASQRAISRR